MVTRPTPPSLLRTRRNCRSVTPAMGARTRGGSIESCPYRIRGGEGTYRQRGARSSVRSFQSSRRRETGPSPWATSTYVEASAR